MELSELLVYDSRLVAFTQELPFQEDKSLSSITEEGEDKSIGVLPPRPLRDTPEVVNL
jgi:hypothetical protein